MKKTLIFYGISGSLLALVAGLLFLTDTDADTRNMILLAIGAIFGVVAFTFDSYGLLSLVFLSLPFSRGILNVEISIITFNPYTLGVLGFLLIAMWKIAMGRARYPVKAEDILIVLLSASFLVSTMLAPDIVDAGFLAFHGIFIPVVTYFVLKTSIATEKQYRQLTIFLVMGIVGFACLSIATYVINPARLRILGQSSISAAGMCAVGIIFCIGSRWSRSAVGKIAALLMFIALFLTYARGYLVLVLFGAPVVFYIIRRGKGFALMFSFLVLSLFGTLLLAYSASEEKPEALAEKRGLRDEQTINRLTDPTQWIFALYGRGVHYYDGLQEFKKSPIIGNGFHQGSDKVGVRAYTWHNFHVEWLEYGGMLGYMLYFLVLLTHFKTMYAKARYDRAIAVNLTIIVILLTNGLTNSFTSGVTPYFGFLLMGLNHARLKLLAREKLRNSQLV